MSLEKFGRYELLKKLATGGMAQIYFARETRPDGTNRHVVVKRILPHMAENPDFIRMFLDEARIAARLNHPNIVEIFDLGSEGDSFFLAMEFIHGDDLRRVWKHAESEGKPLPIPLICRIISDCAAGLDYAHKKTDANGRALNIVHRDISPQNILISFSGVVKVVDFGIAKAADQSTVTRSGVLKGKYSYMSPEQASVKKRTIDCRTDIFALGIVLYELLTGTRLFKRANDIQTLNAVTDCDVTPPSEVNLSLPQSLDAIVMKALAKEPEDRYQEAKHLQGALDEWLAAQTRNTSTAELGAYLRDLYAERLEAEKRQGDGVAPATKEIITSEALPDPAPPKPLRQSKGHKPPVPSAPSVPSVSTGAQTAKMEPLEDTRTERPPTRGERERLPEGELSSTTLGNDTGTNGDADDKTNTLRSDAEPTSRPTGRYALFAVLGLVGVLAVGLLASRKPAPRTTPLEPLAGATLDAAVPVDPDVMVSFRSSPSGAQVTIDGKLAGHTPLDVKLQAHSEPLVSIALEGYQPSNDRFTVGTDPAESHAYELTAIAPAIAPTTPEPATATGGVRFFARPWADVECAPYKLGRTPTAERQLPVGTYTCVFSHPPSAPVKKAIRITPESHLKVSATFEVEAFQ